MDGGDGMKLTLFDRNLDVCVALEEAFAGVPEVKVRLVEGLKETPLCDALATPGNSFGVMTGGLDAAVREARGQGIQDTIQHYIMSLGMPLPVGQVLCIQLEETASARHLLYAPTMYVPGPAVALDICGAMQGIVMAAQERGFQTVAVPGLGTGTGQMAPVLAARAMRAGYDAALAVWDCLQDMQQAAAAQEAPGGAD